MATRYSIRTECDRCGAIEPGNPEHWRKADLSWILPDIESKSYDLCVPCLDSMREWWNGIPILESPAEKLAYHMSIWFLGRRMEPDIKKLEGQLLDALQYALMFKDEENG